MKNAGADVHRLASDIIGNPYSEPNELHEAIVELATQNGEPRIVTTNYDWHLSVCLQERGDFYEYPSGALPQREDFTGIVYLHGSVKEPPDRLVITDADFAEAYLLSPWTISQFLGRLFAGSTVLFVGYSHKDTLMEYLARGLPAESRRYALCDDSEDDRWGEYGITPIEYGSHDALPELLREWVGQAQMGILDHEQRIKRIVQIVQEPDDRETQVTQERHGGWVQLLPLEDESYLRETFGTVERLRLFTRHAVGSGWLTWVEQQDLLNGIFNPAAVHDDESIDLVSKWFAKLAVAPPTAEEALRVFDRSHRQFSQQLWGCILLEVSKSLDGGDAASGLTRRWVPLIAQAAPPGVDQYMCHLLAACHSGGYTNEGLLVLDCLLALVAGLERSYGENWAERRRPAVSRPSRRTGDYWERTFRLDLSDTEVATEVTTIVDRHLRTAHRISACESSGQENWKRLSFGRSAIEEHEQDGTRDGIDVLINVARDALEALMQHNPGTGVRYLVSWADSDMPLLRRLAIHGWTERQDVTADAKIDWLRESGFVFDLYMRHETMRLLAEALPDASEEAADEMVKHVFISLTDDPENDSAESQDRLVYDYLAWIADLGPELDSAQQALATVQARYPLWEPREHPDFHIWASCETIESPTGIDPGQLHRAIQASPRIAMELLWSVRSDSSSNWDSDASWDHSLGVLRSVVEEYPGDGLAMIEYLTERSETGDPGNEQQIVEAILGAWVNADIDEELYRELVARLPRVWETGSARWTRGTGISGSGIGPLNHAINHWSGKTAQIALRLASYEQQQYAPEAAGVSESLRDTMEMMISDGGTPNQHAQVVIAGQVRFLFAADEQWCCERILPLLDPTSDRETAKRCWDGYLHTPSAHPALLEAGLLASILNFAPLVGDWNDDSQRTFYDLLAAISLFTGINPVEHGWLRAFTAQAEPQSRLRWIRAVTAALCGLASSAADAQWDSWMHQYWNDRLRSIPLPITPEEASHLAEWAAYLGERFPRAVDLAAECNAPITEPLPGILTSASDRPDQSDHLSQHPEHAARLLAHLLAHTSTIPPVHASLLRADLEEIVPDLIARLNPDHATPLREQATRLGIPT